MSVGAAAEHATKCHAQLVNTVTKPRTSVPTIESIRSSGHKTLICFLTLDTHTAGSESAGRRTVRERPTLMHPFRIGERVFLSIVFSTIEETVIYLEGGEYFCIVTKGRRLDSDELGIHPGTLVPKDKLFPKASDVIPLSGTLATLPLVSSSCCCRRRLLSQSPN